MLSSVRPYNISGLLLELAYTLRRKHSLFSSRSTRDKRIGQFRDPHLNTLSISSAAGRARHDMTVQRDPDEMTILITRKNSTWYFGTTFVM
jgi:hypothetical protein